MQAPHTVTLKRLPTHDDKAIARIGIAESPILGLVEQLALDMAPIFMFALMLLVAAQANS